MITCILLDSPGVMRSTVTRIVIEIIWSQGEMRLNVEGERTFSNTPCTAANSIAMKMEPLSTAVACAINPGSNTSHRLSRTRYAYGTITQENTLIATANSSKNTQRDET